MNDLELIFSMLGEASTTKITRNVNAKGFKENHSAAKAGGTIAGNARRELEAKSGRSVISNQNYLSSTSDKKTKKVPAEIHDKP